MYLLLCYPPAFPWRYFMRRLGRYSRQIFFLRTFLRAAVCMSVMLLAVGIAPAQSATELSGETRRQIDQIARQVLEDTGVPSASVAVVKDGALAYAHAYGNARLEPSTPATSEMRYKIGSISKQFTAT